MAEPNFSGYEYFEYAHAYNRLAKAARQHALEEFKDVGESLAGASSSLTQALRGIAYATKQLSFIDDGDSEHRDIAVRALCELTALVAALQDHAAECSRLKA